MHPILARPGRLVAYIAIWLPLGVLLAALLALQGVFGWTDALPRRRSAVDRVWLPVSVGLVRDRRIAGRSRRARCASRVTAVAASFLSSAVWLLIARGWLGLIASFAALGRRRRRRSGGGADAVRVRLPAVSAGDGGQLPRGGVQRCRATPSGAASSCRCWRAKRSCARCARRSIRTSLQQPAVDQRADDRRSGGGAADVPAARGLPARDAGARSARADPLSSELALVRKFLSVEQVRFGERLQVEIERPTRRPRRAWCRRCVLQPLVENAVTHGVAHVLEGGVVRDPRGAARGHAGRLPSIIRATRIGRPAAAPGSGSATSASGWREPYGGDAFLQTEERDGVSRSRVEIPPNAAVRLMTAANRDRGRRAAGAGGGARVRGRRSGDRDRGRLRQRVRGGEGGGRAEAGSGAARRADAEAGRLRGAGAARARSAGHLHHGVRPVRAAGVRGARGRLPAEAVQRRAVPGSDAAGARAAAREGGDCRSRRSSATRSRGPVRPSGC